MKNEKPEKQKRPADWKLTPSDLMREMKEGKRKSVGPPDLDWAREYEISLIPKDYRFPQKGDLYEAIINQKINFLTFWRAPMTDRGEGILFKGERIWVPSGKGEPCVSTNALPVDYSTLEQRMIPEKDRSNPKYTGFNLLIKTIDLNEKFKLIATGFEKETHI